MHTITAGGRAANVLAADPAFAIIGANAGEVDGAGHTVTAAVSICFSPVLNSVFAGWLGTDALDTYAAVAIDCVATLEAGHTGPAVTTAVDVRFVAVSNAVFAGGC